MVTNMDRLEIEATQKLINAMVRQARKDYTLARNYLCHSDTMQAGFCLYEDVRTFFCGEWFKTVTSCNGCEIFSRIEMAYNSKHKNDLFFDNGLDNLYSLKRDSEMKKNRTGKTKLWEVSYYSNTGILVRAKITAKDIKQAQDIACDCFGMNVIHIKFVRDL